MASLSLQKTHEIFCLVLWIKDDGFVFLILLKDDVSSASRLRSCLSSIKPTAANRCTDSDLDDLPKLKSNESKQLKSYGKY